MDYQFYDLNLYALFVLAMLLVMLRLKGEDDSLRGRLFQRVVWFTMAMLVLEILSWLFDHQSPWSNRPLNFFTNALLTAAATIVVSAWAFYIDHIVFPNKTTNPRRRWLYVSPTIIMVVLVAINFVQPFLFEISEDNVYTRRSGVWIAAILSYLIYGYVVLLVYRNRRALKNSTLYGVLLFFIIPQVAALIQLNVLGLTLIWPANAAAIVFSYVLFETSTASIDALTGAYSRRRAEDYMRSLLRTGQSFGLLMMDMDDFKQINDTYGHHAGDRALIEMARVLKHAFPRPNMVSRFGGDEFLVVLHDTEEATLLQQRERIYDQLRTSPNDYIRQARFSIGLVQCDTTSDCTIEELMIAADDRMYQDKANNKNYKRRKDDK